MSTLIKWFPDRPGLATGMAIMGFGGGALIASPLSSQLLAWYDDGYDPADPKSVASGSAVSMLFLTLGVVYFAGHDVRRLHDPGARRKAGSRRASTRRR